MPQHPIDKAVREQVQGVGSIPWDEWKIVEAVEAIDTVRQELENTAALFIDAEASEAASVMADKVARAITLLEGAVAVGTIAEEDDA